MLFDMTDDYGIILLHPDGTVRRWNPAAERMFGYSAAEIEGTPGHVIFADTERRAGVPDLELKTAAELGRAEDERWHRRKDGSCFWASGIMVGLRENGNLRGFAKIV